MCHGSNRDGHVSKFHYGIEYRPLSNDTVQQRIHEMGDYIEAQLVQILSRTDHALQIDESTIRDNEALLMGYVQFVHEKETRQEMLFVITLPADTQAASLFEAVKDFYEDKGIPMKNHIVRHQQISRHGLAASRIHCPHETRDSCFSDSLCYPQTPSRG